MARVKIEIKGIEKVDELIQKHQNLMGQLEDNLCEIYNARLELEARLNQPVFMTENEKKAERIDEQLSEGKISINQARKEYDLKSIEASDFTTIDEKRLVTMNEEKELIELIVSYAKQHDFAVSNIMGALQKVREYMADNAILVSEDCIRTEIQSSEENS